IASGDQRDLAFELSGALPEGCIINRGRLQRRLVAGLGLMLFREGRNGILPCAGLHRFWLLFAAIALPILPVDLLLDAMLLAYLFRDVCGVLVLVHLGLPNSCSRQEPNNDGRGNVPSG